MSIDNALLGRALILRKLKAGPEHRERTGEGRTGDGEQHSVSTSVASIIDGASRERAAQLVKEGACVASFVRSVWVLWIDPANGHGVETIYRIKGARRIGRPMGTVLEAESFVEMLDPGKIAPHMR